MGNFSVIVRSIGTAGPSVHAVLANSLPIAPERIARCLYQAPAVLFDALPENEANAIVELLTKTGLEVEAARRETPLEPGGPEYELAVHVREPERFRAIAVELARFLGCQPARAVKLLCSSPAVVLGQVSAATVEALGRRLEPLGAEVDPSRSAEAIYDVFVDADGREYRTRLERELRDAGVEILPEGPVVALGVSRSLAEKLWTRLGASPQWRLIDRAFQRFDVVLESAPDTAEASEAIVSVTGMPPAIVPKVRARAPVVLLSAVRLKEVDAALSTLGKVGVQVTARMVTLARWDLVISSVSNVTAAADVLARVLDRDAAPLNRALRSLPARIDAPVGLVQGQWIIEELEAVGAKAGLEAR